MRCLCRLIVHVMCHIVRICTDLVPMSLAFTSEKHICVYTMTYIKHAIYYTPYYTLPLYVGIVLHPVLPGRDRAVRVRVHDVRGQAEV